MGITDRIDAVTKIAPEYRHAVLPPPRSVKVELTARCNYACSYCARSLRLRNQKDMDRALFERIAKNIRDAGVEELGLFYLGESFMVPWLPEAVAHAKAVGFPYVFLTTNGSLATPERVGACMKAGLDSLKFSFNYADEMQFAAVTGVKDVYFRRTIEHIKAAHKVRAEGGYSCGLYASYIAYDGEQGERMKAAVDEILPFVDEVYALPLYNQAGFAAAEEQASGWKPTAGNRGRLDALRDPLPCWAVFTEGHVTWEGKLSACCFDHDGRFHMGDLKTSSFMDAWNSEAYKSLRTAHLKKDVAGTPCENCVAYQ